MAAVQKLMNVIFTEAASIVALRAIIVNICSCSGVKEKKKVPWSVLYLVYRTILLVGLLCYLYSDRSNNWTE